ncbi:MAG: divalent-cation tolerance protein CutA [Coriobacteriales bacterium]|nr:divalent-cation tolerance protein CutA [Coriobacteriales bacterium]
MTNAKEDGAARDADEPCVAEPCVVVITTVGTEEEARAVTGALLDERLAACVQRIPVSSSYHWQGRRCDEAELMLLIKTRASLYQRAEASIRAHHSYELPEIIQLPIIGGLPEYLHWIAQQTEES